MRYFTLQSTTKRRTLGPMSKRLVELIDKTLLKMGKNGLEKLAIQSGLSPSSVRNAKRTGHLSLGNGYKLALACGCSDEEALSIAKECSSDQATDTAEQAG